MYPPPAHRQIPFSHCQRPFGLKTTTRSYHTTSHRVGPHYPKTLGTFFYKYSMDIQDCIDIVEKLLRQNNRRYKDSHAQMIYERGYLTGLIARLMIENPNIRLEIIEQTKKH